MYICIDIMNTVRDEEQEDNEPLTPAQVSIYLCLYIFTYVRSEAEVTRAVGLAILCREADLECVVQRLPGIVEQLDREATRS